MYAGYNVSLKVRRISNTALTINQQQTEPTQLGRPPQATQPAY